MFQLFDYSPHLDMADRNGCTAGKLRDTFANSDSKLTPAPIADFASALDNIWPHFAAEGCVRTSKQELIHKNIIYKVTG